MFATKTRLFGIFSTVVLSLGLVACGDDDDGGGTSLDGNKEVGSLTADEYPFFVRYWFPGPPWEVPEQYFRRSPLSLVGNVKTPTMLLTGEQDWRTPISQAEEYYQALKLRGVDTALVRIPDSSHGLADRPSQLVAKVLHVLKWFELLGGTPAVSER